MYTSLCNVFANVLLLVLLNTKCYICGSDDFKEVVCKNASYVVGGSQPHNAAIFNKYCSATIQSHVTLFYQTSIRCDFKHEQQVTLTENTYCLWGRKTPTGYVKMENARALHVTSSFLEVLASTPSVGFDIWGCGEVTLEETPPLDGLQKYSSYKTFMAVGIMDSKVSRIPSNFIRDKRRGALSVRNCEVALIQTGVFSDIQEVTYLVIENSIIDKMEGPLSSSGVLTVVGFNKYDDHTFPVIQITNTTVQYMAVHAMAVVHQSNIKTLHVDQCTIEEMEQEAISVDGNMNVIVFKNVFNNIKTDAIKVNVTGNVTITENILRGMDTGALSQVGCNNITTIRNNTFITYDHLKLHPSCRSLDLVQMDNNITKITHYKSTTLFKAKMIKIGLPLILSIALLIFIIIIIMIFVRKRYLRSICRQSINGDLLENDEEMVETSSSRVLFRYLEDGDC